jgi:hypothetical protein
MTQPAAHGAVARVSPFSHSRRPNRKSRPCSGFRRSLASLIKSNRGKVSQLPLLRHRMHEPDTAVPRLKMFCKDTSTSRLFDLRAQVLQLSRSSDATPTQYHNLLIVLDLVEAELCRRCCVNDCVLPEPRPGVCKLHVAAKAS